jgi:hypothetical protein
VSDAGFGHVHVIAYAWLRVTWTCATDPEG